MELSKLVGKLLFNKSNIKVEDFSKGGIYLIKSTKSNNVYVGKTYKSFVGRLLEHQYSILKGTCTNKHLMRAVNKYGFDTFELYILDFLPNDLQNIAWKIKNHKKYELEHPGEYKKILNWLNEKEVYWVNYYKKASNVYNQNDGGNGGNPTKEVRQAIGKATKERWEDPEYKKNTSNSIHESYTEELREYIGKTSKERWQDPEYKEATIASMKQAANTDEAKERNSTRFKNLWKQEDYRNKMINIQNERVKDPLYLEKLSKANTGKKRTNETKQKLSESITKAYENDPNYAKTLSIKQSKKMENPEYRRQIGKAESETKKEIYQRKLRQLKSLLLFLYAYEPRLEKMSIKSKWKMFYELLKHIEKLNVSSFTMNDMRNIINNDPSIIRPGKYHTKKNA